MRVPDKLRVLHVTPTFGVGGAEQMASYLMIGLSETHEIAGATLYPPFNSAVEVRLTQAHIPLWHLDKRPGFDPAVFRALNRVFAEVKPHVVHTHLSVLRYALPCVMWQKVPVVIHTLHNLAEHETDRFGRWLQWFAFRKRVVPVAISREVAASVERVYGIECNTVVPNCIPVEKYRPVPEERARWRNANGFSADDTLFVCVGRFEEQKNPLLLLGAFERVKDPKAHLVLLGTGALHDRVVDYVREHRLGDRVHVLGKRSDVPACLAAGDAFVLASDWEGSPLAVMEAMSAGLPVISTAVGGVPELVETGSEGILVPRRDAAGLANAMETLARNVELRRKMAAAAVLRAERSFKVDRMAQGYAQVYQQSLTAAA